MIGLIGVTGEVGGLVYSYLSKFDRKLCLLIRNPQKVIRCSDNRTVVRFFDFSILDPRVFADIQLLLWILPNDHTKMLLNEREWLWLAKKSGVKHVVKLSVMRVDNDDIFHHALSEKYVEESGIAYTHLRPNTFMQNFNNYELQDIVAGHELRFPAKDGKTSFIDSRDIAAVATEVLLHPQKHSNRAYTLTGPQALSYGEVADRFTSILGKKIKYIDTSFSTEVRDVYKLNHPFYAALKRGEFSDVSPDVEQILQRPAIKLENYIADYKSYFK